MAIEPSMRSIPGPHTLSGDRLDLVVPQEPCDPGMMSALGALVTEGSPGNRELLPAADLAADHISDRYAISPAPARVNSPSGVIATLTFIPQDPSRRTRPAAGAISNARCQQGPVTAAEHPDAHSLRQLRTFAHSAAGNYALSRVLT